MFLAFLDLILEKKYSVSSYLPHKDIDFGHRIISVFWRKIINLLCSCNVGGKTDLDCSSGDLKR